MHIPSMRRGRLRGALAVLALVAGGLLAAATPATAAPAVTTDCDPAGVLFVDPSSITSGDQMTVSWNIIGAADCRPRLFGRLSGPGFNGDEVLPTFSGQRRVTVTQPGPSVATWTLFIASTLGETQLDSESVTVNQLILFTGLGGGAVAFADATSTETKAELDSFIPGNGPAIR